MVMMRILVGAIIATLGWGTGASAATLDQLAAMQTLVRVEIDGTRLCPDEFKEASQTQIAGLPQRLEGEIRSRLAEMTLDSKRAFLEGESRTKLCTVRCRCGIYANWIENVEELAPLRASLLEREKKSKLSEPKYVACARANRDWICKNSEFKKFIQGDE
jgi:hypothetical protein